MDIAAVAGELSAARKAQRLIPPPSRRNPEFSVEDGYAVGRFLHQEFVDSGWVPIGLKLGFTNQAIWNQLGPNRPFWAPIYDRTVTDRSEVSLAGLVAPRIEPEIAPGFSTDLQAGASSIDVSAAIIWAALGFEIVQCHYPGWEMRPGDAVADAGLHGVLIVGDRRELPRRKRADWPTSTYCCAGRLKSSPVGAVRPRWGAQWRRSFGYWVCPGSKGFERTRQSPRAL
jgi:2-keto-4-pentenoate hydratase